MGVVFDIGMYDAADTMYYLEEGHDVVAVEANPNLVRRARERLRAYVGAGRLHLVDAAIGVKGGSVDLVLCGDDLGSSSIVEDRVAYRNPTGSFSVPTVGLQDLFGQYGLPDYLKVDIEGADRLCVLALTRKTRPEFLSFEVGDDVEELVDHAEEIGYRRFKLINQLNFRELSNQRSWYDRVTRRIFRRMGYDEPRMVRRGGRFFRVAHSSGPAPWRSDGPWHSAEALLSNWREAKSAGRLSDWYDVHVA